MKFKLVSVSGCGGMLRAPSGSIKSPNYPRPYHNRARCVWVISAPIGNIISIFVRDLQLEYQYACRYDYLVIRDGNSHSAAQIATLCGSNRISKVFTSTGNYLHVSFQSDFTITASGFDLHYTSG